VLWLLLLPILLQGKERVHDWTQHKREKGDGEEEDDRISIDRILLFWSIVLFLYLSLRGVFDMTYAYICVCGMNDCQFTCT